MTQCLPLLQNFGFFRIVDGQNEEIDEPTERVLVHRFNIGQVSNGEEQHSWVRGDRRVTHTGGVYLLFCLVSYGLNHKKTQLALTWCHSIEYGGAHPTMLLNRNPVAQATQ